MNVEPVNKHCRTAFQIVEFSYVEHLRSLDRRKRWRRGYSAPTNSKMHTEEPLPVVWPVLQAACDGRISPEVLLHRTSTGILDRGPPLDDESDRGRPTLGRLPQGVSHERARCLSAIPVVRDPLAAGAKDVGPPA